VFGGGVYGPHSDCGFWHPLVAWAAIGIRGNERLVFNTNTEPAFAPGFRLSLLDASILIVGVGAAVALAMVVWWWGFAVVFVLGHFFLFCNVVRMARPLELAWAGVFLALAAGTVALDAPGWPVTASVSLVATVVLVVVEMRKPSYHGLGWQWINPGLAAWWEARKAEGGAG
jgi:hypothetical protein